MIRGGVVWPGGSAAGGWTAASGVDGVPGRRSASCRIAASEKTEINLKMVFMSVLLHDLIIAAAGKRLVCVLYVAIPSIRTLTLQLFLHVS